MLLQGEDMGIPSDTDEDNHPVLFDVTVCTFSFPQGEDMGIPSDTDEDNQEEEISSESGFGNVFGEPECLAAVDSAG